MATKEKLGIGAIVRLKSGGPDMTVKSLPSPSYSTFLCQWFAGKKLEEGRFPVDSLDLVKTEKQ